MNNLQHRQQKIQEKRKQTPRRQFLMEIASRYPLLLYKQEGLICMFDKNTRVGFVNKKDYAPDLVTTDSEGISFFDNFSLLLLQVGLPNLIHFSENINSDYANCVLGSKNIYLSYTVIKDVENAMYSFSVKTGSRNVIDSLMVWDNSEHIYKSKCVISSYQVFYSKFINNSSDIRFSSNLIGCRECLFCDGLINQTYCIRNKQYEKEEYIAYKNKLLFSAQGSYDARYEQVSNQGQNSNSTNSEGNYIVNCNDVKNASMLYEIDHARNAILIGGNDKGCNVYDCFLNTPPIDSIYGGLSLGTGCEHIYNSMHLTRSNNIYSSLFLEDCSFCLGCIGLKNKQFCIFNKQYTKEEWYEKADEIFAQMEGDGTLGDFFPGSMNPFYFNDTAAYLIDNSFTKQEVTVAGYLRRDEPIKVDIPAGVQTVKNTELDQFEGRKVPLGKGDGEGSEPGGSKERRISDEILKKVILDEQGNAYRVIPMELEFLRKHGLPLPRKHRLERMKENFRIG